MSTPSKNKHGGARKGAGKPAGTLGTASLQGQIQRQLLIDTLEPYVKEITLALAKKAAKGNVKAAELLFDRAWGKAPQPLTGEQGGPVQVTVVKYAKPKA